MNKTIITVVGKNTIGIITKVCTYLTDNQINILDISQVIVQGFSNVMIIADDDGATRPFEVVPEELGQLGDGIGTKIKRQREEIFTKMHRI